MRTPAFLPFLIVSNLFLSGTSGWSLNVIQAENLDSGTTDWRLTNPAGQREIEGYASATSVNAGGQISLFVNTSAPSYTIEIYRMGWYQGLGGRLWLGPISRPGTVQPVPTPDPNGTFNCNWTNPYVLSVPSNWVSGFYLAKLHNSNGKESYIIFVVRNDGRNADFIFQSAVTTYQAYNNWPGVALGGKSLYKYMNAGCANVTEASKVSFNRPYGPGINQGTTGPGPDYGPYSLSGVGAGDFLTHDFSFAAFAYSGGSQVAGWEYSMVRWLEKEGYDVAYLTDVDNHANGALLLGRRGFLSVGHDEYWSPEMRQHVEAARDSGVHLGFFGGNICFWKILFEPDSSGTPNRVFNKGVRYDRPGANEEEERLIGGSWAEGSDARADILIGDTTHWIFSDTRLAPGDLLPELVGYEWNFNKLGLPTGVQILAHSPVGCWSSGGPNSSNSDMTIYRASSGAVVFSVGTIQWSWGLDDYNTGIGSTNGPPMRASRLTSAAQQITRNVLSRFLSSAIENRMGDINLNSEGAGLSFNGIDEAAEVPHATELNSFPLTVQAWIKTVDSGDAKGIVSKYGSGELNGYQMYLHQGRLRAWYFRDSTKYIWDGGYGLDGGTINDGQWHHVAFTVDASGGKLYVDGSLRASRAWTGASGPPTTGRPLRFGEYHAGYLYGQLDEISVWSIARTAADILATFRQKVLAPQPNLIGNWPLDDGTGMWALDNTGHGHGASLSLETFRNNFQGDCEFPNPPTVVLYSCPVWVPETARSFSPAFSCLNLDGQYLEAAHSPDLNAYPLTVTAWVKTTNSTGTRGIVNKYVSGSGNGYQVFLSNGHVHAWYFRDNTRYVWDGGYGLDGGSINDGQWHHVAFTVDASGGNLYVDGSLRAGRAWTGTAGACTTTAPFRFGEYNGGLFSGQIDEVGLWSVARSAPQIHDGMGLGLLGTESGLIGYWRFDEGGGFVAGDNSNYRHNAVSILPLPWQASTAPLSCPPGVSSVSLNGTNQYVQVDHADELNCYPLTVTAWAKTTNSSGIKGIVNKYASGSGNGYQVFLSNGQVRAWYFGDLNHCVWDGAEGLNGGSIADGEWHYLAFTVDGGGGKLYIDGALKDSRGWTGTPAAATTTQPLRFGEYNGGYFPGGLDEVSVWKIARSPEMIALGSHQRLSGSELGLIGYWRFDEGTGNSTADTSHHDRPGALIQTPSWVSSTIPCPGP